MQKQFNITGTCIPGKNYMVNIDHKIQEIFSLIEEGAYFTINRPRQYGKTTTLFLMSKFLSKREDYLPLKISFEGIGSERYQNAKSFIEVFLSVIEKSLLVIKQYNLAELTKVEKELDHLDQLGTWITKFVLKAEKKVVLLIDEVDKSSNNQLFLDFLGMLRIKYLDQREEADISFHSLIFAGVQDVKTLRNFEGKTHPEEEKIWNIPWNIATNFYVDMSFQPEEIITMLQDYSQEKKVIMSFQDIAEKLHYFTDGYPFLVSQLCKIMDEELMQKPQWDEALLELAVQNLVQRRNTNFDHLVKNLDDSEDLQQMLFDFLIGGRKIPYSNNNATVLLGEIFGVLKNQDRRLAIHNRIYQWIIYDYFTTKMVLSEVTIPYYSQTHFLLSDETLNMENVLLKFQEFMKNQYSEKDEAFVERNGRLIFLAFLKSIINGKGFDFKEVEISEEKRLDVVITYLNRKYVLELKIWRGEAAHQEGIKQLYDYLERLNANQGYLLIFDFTKGKIKDWNHEKIKVQEKEIFIAWV